jgi:hypothetical protein
LADFLCLVGCGERQFDRATFHPLRGHQAGIGERPLWLVQGDVFAGVLFRVDQHPFGLFRAAQRCIGPREKQPCGQPPWQWRLCGQCRQCLLE